MVGGWEWEGLVHLSKPNTLLGSSVVMPLRGLVLTYGAGDAVGELALLYNAPRAATVVANTELKVWALSRSDYRKIASAGPRNPLGSFANAKWENIEAEFRRFCGADEKLQLEELKSLLSKIFGVQLNQRDSTGMTVTETMLEVRMYSTCLWCQPLLSCERAYCLLHCACERACCLLHCACERACCLLHCAGERACCLLQALDTDQSGDIDIDELRAAWRTWFGSVLKPVCALLIIDVQNDFIDGSLSLKHCPAGQDGAAIVPVRAGDRASHPRTFHTLMQPTLCCRSSIA